jgi:hypothetical protein
MSWPSSMGVAALSAAFGLVCGGLIALACVGWYRVSSFEGRSGYFVVAWALAGAAAAFVIGLVVARFAGGEAPAFAKVLGAALGAVLVVALAALLLCRLFADMAPTIDGRPLELEVELRVPVEFTLLDPAASPSTASVHVASGRSQPFGVLRFDDSVVEGERRVVRVSVPLDTSAADKRLWVRFAPMIDVYFPLPLGARPAAADREWSAWLAAENAPGGAAFEARYRVRAVEPAPPEPDPEHLRQQAFAALAPDAPLAAWLPYLFESPTPERTAVVVAHIDAQQAELADLIRSTDARLREYGLRATSYPRDLAPAVVDAVRDEGRAIAAALREAAALPSTDARRAELLDEFSERFRTWKSLWWSLATRVPLDARPLLREIEALASPHASDRILKDIATDAAAIAAELDRAAAGD